MCMYIGCFFLFIFFHSCGSPKPQMSSRLVGLHMKYISTYLVCHFQCQQSLSNVFLYWLAALTSLPPFVLGCLVTEDMWQTRSAFTG